MNKPSDQPDAPAGDAPASDATATDPAVTHPAAADTAVAEASAAEAPADTEQEYETFEVHRPEGDLVARAGTYFRVARYILVVAAIAMGGWFAYDGWIGYPAENQQIAELQERQAALPQGSQEYVAVTEELNELTFHNTTSLRTQQALGVGLPILALAYLAYFMHKSRGQFRLSGDTLEVPGQGRVKLDEITELHTEKWERKGIADADYETADGRTGRFRLDDFIYQSEPIDWIFVEIAERHAPESARKEKARLRRRAAKKAGIELPEEDEDLQDAPEEADETADALHEETAGEATANRKD